MVILMNADQVLNYLIREGADHYDQRIAWSASSDFTQQQAEFLLHMPFVVFSCDRCGETYYVGDERGWIHLTGTKPTQGEWHHVNVKIGEGVNDYMEWTLCRYCFNQLKLFAKD